MKKIVLFIALLSFGITKAQIVNIPDANFKNKLLNYSPIIDTNNDNEIQESEAVAYNGSLSVTANNISNLTGIEAFINITELNCAYNNLSILNLSQNSSLVTLRCNSNELTNLDLSQNVNLINLYCTSNELTAINVSQCISLEILRCGFNQLTSLEITQNSNLELLHCFENSITDINFSNNINIKQISVSGNPLVVIDLSQNSLLEYLECSSNQFSTLDLSNNPNLISVMPNNNSNLLYVNLKNGNNDNFPQVVGGNSFNFSNLPNLETICVDDVNSVFVNDLILYENLSQNIFTEYCSFFAANHNTINGNIRFDLDNNGCGSSDLPMSNLMIVSNNGTDNFATFTQSNGDYLFYTTEGDFITTITTSLPNYYSANPSTQNNTFTGFENNFIADFCIEPNQTVSDVNISLIPPIEARPGFNAMYQIVYKNLGTTQLNGNVTLEFDETKLSFQIASETVSIETSNTLAFDYVNLNPFETKTIDLEFYVFAPPEVNNGDILNFTASINPIAGDLTVEDNIFTLYQVVTGSYDPNNITCLEGDEILLTDVSKYLHYVVRFQNTGTASAINVVVKNILDDNLDWSTLQLESLSHNNRVAIKNGNEIEFIFENINLPDSTTDEPNSHGFIAYKIKPNTDIALGDIILNKADIFFDFNTPIETNVATTTIVNTLAVKENILLDFSVYPTPTESILNIKSKTKIIKIEIYNKLGQKIKETTENQIDISNLTQGLYFLKAEDINGDYGVKKIVKK